MSNSKFNKSARIQFRTFPEIKKDVVDLAASALYKGKNANESWLAEQYVIAGVERDKKRLDRLQKKLEQKSAKKKKPSSK